MAGPLSDKLIVFTGTLTIKRTEAKSLAEKQGAKVGNSITGKTDIVIAAADAGSKLALAESKGACYLFTDTVQPSRYSNFR